MRPLFCLSVIFVSLALALAQPAATIRGPRQASSDDDNQNGSIGYFDAHGKFHSREKTAVGSSGQSTPAAKTSAKFTPDSAAKSGAGKLRTQQSDENALMAVVSPTVRFLSVSQGEDAQVNPSQIMSQVIPRVANDAKKRKWPFNIMPVNTVESVFQTVIGHERKPTDDVLLADLKPLATKINCRYLLVFRVNELVARHKEEFFISHSLHGRANVDVLVYDRTYDAYVWRTNRIAETAHAYTVFNTGLRREQDGALNAAITSALEPFAKGERMTVERPKLNIVITVQKVLADGKRVLLDAGRSSNIQVGDVLKSVESDFEAKIVEVLDNGAIAEVITGSPTDKEILKLK